MNTIKAAALLIFATAGAAVSAADLAAVPATGAASVTRADVKRELQLAIANGEIRHGDLADFEALVAPGARHTAPAESHAMPAQANRVAGTQTLTPQTPDAAAKSSGR